MRQIVLDTETTGLNPRTGDRVIEVGCVELHNRMLTGNNFHRYINPERDSEEGALAVHGLTTEFLRDKPKFAEIAQELREYIQGAEVIIHNAPFDLGFLNNEFKLLGLPTFTEHCSGVIDTLVNAKEMHPGKRNSLDALCDRYGVSNAHRKLHGALLDAELLADVYLSMTRGQNSLSMDVEDESAGSGGTLEAVALAEVIILAASADELVEHESVLSGLDKAVKGNCIWRNYAEA
ncbi:DNA polymerase III subunit epsilon [Massilia pseudoviolaceinigra]|uniref:DNA polymerase III subunit epsilon n=1 Tax=Massilia pseudoviolaceinigra TaxID=3057165 RepID=UPI002796B4D5|nr:DNA polymerase III subunit epsilon [Massilia sp. CCM 9206]MDQ1921286.1 DNA polymerase III subunit epsilon [Massilia sp. CCM 9206]